MEEAVMLDKIIDLADRLDKKGEHEAASKLDGVLNKLAVPGVLEFLGLKQKDAPGMGQHQYLQQQNQQQSKPESVEPKPESKPEEAPPKPRSKPVLNYTKAQLEKAIKADPIQEAVIREYLVPALNEWVAGSSYEPLDVFSSKPIAEVLDAADKAGMLAK